MFTTIEKKALVGLYKLCYQNLVAANELEAAAQFASAAKLLEQDDFSNQDMLKDVLAAVTYICTATEKLVDDIPPEMVPEKLRAATVKTMYAEIKRKLENATKSEE